MEEKIFGLCICFEEECFPLELKKVDIVGTIDSNFAKIKLTQLYINNFSRKGKGKDTLDAFFVFPIQEDAAVVAFESKYRGQTSVAELKIKTEAEEIFQKAKSEGKYTALTEEILGDVFKISIGQIQPQEEVEITFEYVCLLKENKLVLPTYVAPRYTKKSYGFPLQTFSSSSSSSSNIVSLSLLVLSPKLSPFVRSPSHDLFVSDQEITFRKSRIPMEKDIVILFDDKQIQPYAYLDQTNHFFFVSVPRPMSEVKKSNLHFPSQPILSSSLSREYIFIVDQSGSMQEGNKMKALREVLQLALRSLPENDSWFNIVRFGSSYQALWGNSKKYSDDTLEKAAYYIQGLEPDLGGTELYEPIKIYFQEPESQTWTGTKMSTQEQDREKKKKPIQSKIVIALTDGQIDSQNEISHFIKMIVTKSKIDLRLYTIGIGDSVSRDTLTKLAIAGRGQSYFSNEATDLNSIIVNIFQDIESPTLLNYIFKHFPIQFDHQQSSFLFQQKKNRLYWLAPFFGEIEEKEFLNENKSIVELELSDSRQLKIPFSWNSKSKSTFLSRNESILPFIWAKQRIRDLEMEIGSEKEIKEISLKYHVLSNQTAFVLVDPRQQPISIQTIQSKPKYKLQQQKSGARVFSKRAASLPRPTLNYIFQQESAKVSSSRSDLDDPVYRSLHPDYSEQKQQQEKKEQQASSSKENILFVIIQAQTANGSFTPPSDFIDHLSKEIKLELGMVTEDIINKDRRDLEWPTIVVVVYLYAKLQDRKNEWELMGEKAQKYLYRKGVNISKWQDFIQKISS